MASNDDQALFFKDAVDGSVFVNTEAVSSCQVAA
jgi:hypothetical protein